MKRYDSYKDSGVEWIGEIPSHWDTNRLKWVSQIENSGVWGEDDEFPNSVNVPIPTTGQLSIEGEWYYDKMNLRNLSFDEWNKYKCVEGDIIVVKSSGSSTNIITGKCGFISKEDSGKFGFSNFLMRVRPVKMIPKLVYYFLSSNLTKQRIERMVSSTTYPNLKVDEYSNSELFIPPLSEQQQIVSYLDSKTTQIDSLIEKSQRKIELLKEKRTSLINELVTKGLSPNVDMKDSGVEWIGEIPIHWDMVKLKQLFCINKRISGELGFDVLSVTQRGLKIKNLENNEGQHSMDYSKYQLVLEGDFVMNHMDLLTGYVDISKQIGVTSPDYRVFTKSSERVNSLYYLYFFQLCYIRRIFYGLGRGVSNLGRWRLPSLEFLNIYLPFPPKEEQQEIVSYLDEQTQLIDKTISLEEKRIELLKEYRQALISEVVTGKIKVF
jgi:type I restriction enzyme S subunit